jgi:hypothetical protein
MAVPVEAGLARVGVAQQELREEVEHLERDLGAARDEIWELQDELQRAWLARADYDSIERSVLRVVAAAERVAGDELRVLLAAVPTDVLRRARELL